MSRYIFILIFMSIFFAACSAFQNRKEPMEIGRMKVIVWDLIKAGEWHQQRIVSDTLLKNLKEDVRLYAQVFSIHGITRDAFLNSYKHYEAHPDKFKTLIDSVEAFANRDKHAGYNRINSKSATDSSH